VTSPEPSRISDRPSELLRIHHVAFAHDKGLLEGSSIEAGLERLFGLSYTEEVGPGFTERTYRIGESALQTLCSTSPGPVARFVARRGAALHHVAVEVADIDAALGFLREKGVRLVDEKARPGGGATRIAFVHPSELGGLLLELVEVQRE
jgi:methylmalonyl-CoA epimerase